MRVAQHGVLPWTLDSSIPSNVQQTGRVVVFTSELPQMREDSSSPARTTPDEMLRLRSSPGSGPQVRENGGQPILNGDSIYLLVGPYVETTLEYHRK